jgi:hypothetical protein
MLLVCFGVVVGVSSDPAEDAAERSIEKMLPREGTYDALDLRVAAREALAWAADVLAQEVREQWQRDAEGVPGAQMIAQRLTVLEQVIRGD